MSGSPAQIRVTTASEAAAFDAAAIAGGTPSGELMRHAGERAAAEIHRRFTHMGRAGVAIFAGAGNNGGDGYVVARALAALGVAVRIIAVGEPGTPDAIAARNAAVAAKGVTLEHSAGDAKLIVDALLGTGSSGAPRGAIAAAIASIDAARARGVPIISLDLPSGLNADTGEAAIAVRPDLTLTFGTVKRGLLRARDAAGAIALIDIGLGALADRGDSPMLVTPEWVHSRVPILSADSYKGDRGKLVIVGGQPGMAGAPMLAARGAMRSGIGMVRLVVARENIPVVQTAVPQAMAAAWPARDDEVRDAINNWADVVLIGPGLGDSPQSRELVERVLTTWRGPVVVDADALNVFRGDTARLGALLTGRPALLTPHAGECARLLGTNAADVIARSFEIGGELARAAKCAVLLKGVPTVITAESGARYVSATGTPALGTAGSGDVLAGIAATMLEQLGNAADAGAVAAWVHGRAAELVNVGRRWRGITLDQIETAVSSVWALKLPAPHPHVLAELPAIGEVADRI